MKEWIPLVLGLLLGLGASRIGERAVRRACLVVGSVSTGLVVSAATGELAESVVFFAFDSLQVLLAAVMALGAVTVASRRQSGHGDG